MLNLIHESLLLFGHWLNENVIHKELGSHLDVEKAVNNFMEEVNDGNNQSTGAPRS